ncbi:putative CRISPR-associated protein [Thiopseudomonas alkaliphila]|uniref:CRISPR-associated protein n=1 Tax=Thiopseudomonas alkaliphila TaxID=1697053 RepID=A0AAW7DXX2_9GAMM|nr:putative CRISPR-associated protein [Thiopseudomonas alkaliphila]MDM1697272.1 putative CRISPR-associated protein [Thiopseudomonas alkaliphila]
MQKDKCIICTIGTSIANGCELQREYFKPGYGWEEDTKEFERQISQRVAGLQQDVRRVSAEMNSLERLDLTPASKVILLATDNAASKACANGLKKLIEQHFSLADKNVEIKRIKGLQVHDVKALKEQGFRELVTTVLSYLTDDALNYQYEVILNPTGGYKGVMPFLTLLGMLYGKSSVYIFEHAEQLISLPPLPFSFDIEIYNRVVPALKRIDEQTAISEQEYYAHIIDYTEQEKPLFTSFIEPIGDNLVTISPLAEVLLSIENRNAVPMVSQSVIEQLQSDNTQPALALKRLIKNSVNPLWRKQHSEKWHQTDLIVIKQNATAERLAGFVKDNVFHVAYVFRTHEAYELELPKYDVQSAKKLKYKQWEITENVGQAQSDNSAGLLTERDQLLAQNLQLTETIKNLKEKADDNELIVMESKEQIDALQQKIATLEQQKEQANNTQQELKQQLKEQQTAQKATPKGFWSGLASFFKSRV